jgi:transposase
MKKDGRSLSHETLERYRLASLELRKRGVPVGDIAESFGVRIEAVSRWFKKSKEKGVRSLMSSKSGGRSPHLNQNQLSETIRALRKPASELGYATDLWSGPRLRHWIKKKFGISYHPKHMSRFLRRLGLKLKVPERRALEQDSKAVRKWKRIRLPALEDQAKRDKSRIFYADESLISLIPYIGKTWAFPDAKPIARVSGKRGQHIGVTAAVNRQGRMCFELTKENENFTMKTFIRFVKKLRREFSRNKIVLIVDGASVHTGKLVTKYVLENSKWLQLDILPAYSPELNPSEKCWGFVKTKKLNAAALPDKAALRGSARKALRQIRNDKNRVKSFFVGRY